MKNPLKNATSIEDAECPACEASVMMNKKYIFCYSYICGECDFYMKRNFLKKFGYYKLTKEAMRLMLINKRIFIRDLKVPYTNVSIDAYCCFNFDLEKEKWGIKLVNSPIEGN